MCPHCVQMTSASSPKTINAGVPRGLQSLSGLVVAIWMGKGLHVNDPTSPALIPVVQMCGERDRLDIGTCQSALSLCTSKTCRWKNGKSKSTPTMSADSWTLALDTAHHFEDIHDSVASSVPIRVLQVPVPVSGHRVLIGKCTGQDWHCVRDAMRASLC
jgi:hypothetical protein